MKCTALALWTRSLLRVAALIAAGTAGPMPSSADVGTACLYGEQECEARRIYLYRTIRLGDDEAIRTLLERGTTRSGERVGTTGISLHSSGGNVEVAMQIGRLLRSRNARAVLLPDGYCYSACVLVLMGAVDRIVAGRIGVHRPHFTDFGYSRTVDDVGTLYKRMRSVVEAYADEMNVNRLLVDLMFSIEPAEMRVLSMAEVTYYGLDRTDPAYAEFRVMEQARIYMISPTEYRRREKLIEKHCYTTPDVEKQMECQSQIRLGLDPETYLGRRAIFDRETKGITDRDRRI